MRKLPIFRSIRSKLIALLLVLVGFPLLVTGYLSYRSASEALLKQTTRQLGNLADKTAQQIDNFFLTIGKDINLLADYPFIQLAFLQYEFHQRLDTVQRLLADYNEKNGYLSRIYLIALDGRPILTVPSTDLAGYNFNKDPWFLHTIREGASFSDVNSHHDFGKGGIFAGKIIFDFEDPAQPVGVLAFHIKPSAYTDFARSLQVGSGGYALIMHDGGNVIHHPDQRLLFTSEFIQRGDTRFQALIRQMTQGEKGHGLYGLAGEEKFLVYSPCRERPWSVGITVREAELMADINGFQKKMLTFFLVIILLILPSSYLFIKGLTRPIKQLIDGAGRIGSGDLDQVIHIESSDELRDVAEEFNKMAVQLKASMNQIIDLKNFNDDILRNVTSGIITVDNKGRVTSFNASAAGILDYSPPSGPDRQPDVIPDHLHPVRDAIRQTLDTGRGVEQREMALSGTGRELSYVEINTSLLSSMAGKIFGVIVEIRDITQRKRMEDVMLRVEKLASLGELSAGMAHEIRNPLAGIKTSVQVLTKRVTQAASKDLLSGIESEINRLNKIVTDLLRFSRPAPPLPEPVDIIRLLEMTLDLMVEKLKGHGISIERLFGKDIPSVVADREQIRQVVLNLLLNSIKAMESGGQLSIEVHPAGGNPDRLAHARATENLQLSRYLKIVMADTGCGIEPRHLKKIFDPFFTTDPRGTGLGLAIAHKLIEENSGSLFIDSIKGKGTRAILLLPIARNESS